MKCISLLLCAAFCLSSRALGPRPAEVLGTREIPTAPAAEIIVGRSEGRLESRGGCLYLTRQAPGRVVRLLVIWPLHTRFNGSLVVPGESTTPVTFRVGETLVIEGSAVEWNMVVPRVHPELAAWRDRCGEQPVFVGSIRRAD